VANIILCWSFVVCEGSDNQEPAKRKPQNSQIELTTVFSIGYERKIKCAIVKSQLAIVDCQSTFGNRQSVINSSQSAFGNRQSSIVKSQSTFGNRKSSIHNIKLAIIKNKLPFDGCKHALRHIKLDMLCFKLQTSVLRVEFRG
jgi:hypothetical protein